LTACLRDLAREKATIGNVHHAEGLVNPKLRTKNLVTDSENIKLKIDPRTFLYQLLKKNVIQIHLMWFKIGKK
jgi:hypothetical protein